MASLDGMRVALLLATLLALAPLVIAQDCFYPNGDVSTEGDAQCSSDGGACCPYNWGCMSNGLCFNPSANIYGRFTCTDQTWQSSNCPQICTGGNTASGNEALLQCADGSWCCDGNRSGNCCTEAGINYFNLAQGSQIAFISTTAVVTSASTLSNQPAPTSKNVPASSSPAASSTPSTVASSAAPSTLTTSSSTADSDGSFTQSSSSSSAGSSIASSQSVTQITQSSVVSGTNGPSTIVSVVTQVISQSAVASAGKKSASSHLGMITGLAVGMPVLLVACALLAFCLLKRRKSKQRSNDENEREQQRPAMADMYPPLAPGDAAPELDGTPRACGQIKSGRESELPGSADLLQSPALSTATAGTAPPEYSPMVQQEPQELWAGYMPYRQPRTELPASTQGA